mmetsp:Transcript_47471/g.148482  ORF Transcript_47471/g.148482 Transcript_47471/m.148482 type:complete len:124 (-) Transcript_47471:215-586(-)
MVKRGILSVFCLLLSSASYSNGYLHLDCLTSIKSFVRSSSLQSCHHGTRHRIKLRMCNPNNEEAVRMEKAMAYAKVFKEEGVPGDMRMFNVNKVARGTDAVLADSRLAKVYMYAKMFNEMPKR